jgi:hypothetical protein
MSSKIEKIRASCSIEWAWKILGLPGQPGRTCKSPFREDKKPSFSVYAAKDGQRWYDQAEGTGGDIIDFWAKAKDLTVQAAVEQLGNMIGESKPPAAKYVPPPEKLIDWPDDLRPPTDLECESLAMLRELPAGAFDLAGRLGFLKVGTHRGELLWFLTDASRRGAEGKTFTGEPCAASGRKVVTLKGSDKSWAYGLISDRPEWDAMKKIVVVEGMPDFFAALALLIDWPGNARVVAMLGASANPGEEMVSRFRGHQVLIIPHNDPEGTKAKKKWIDQLLGFEAKVFTQKIPEGSKDVNEFLVNPGNENPLDLFEGLAHGQV